MCLGILLIHKMNIVGADQSHSKLIRQFQQLLIHHLLQLVSLVVGTLNGSLMQLQLQIVILAKYTLIPLHSLLGSLNIAVGNLLWHLATQTSRATNQALAILLQLLAVGTRTHIVTICPRL